MNRTSWDAGGLQRFAPVACAVMSLAMGAHGWLVLVECLAWWVFSGLDVCAVFCVKHAGI